MLKRLNEQHETVKLPLNARSHRAKGWNHGRDGVSIHSRDEIFAREMIHPSPLVIVPLR